MRLTRVVAFARLIAAAVGPFGAEAAPPDPTITSGPASPTNQTSASFAFSESDASATLLCDLDGQGFAVCDTSISQSYSGPLTAGSHVFSLKARDDSDSDSNVVLFNWTIDQTAPQITFSGVPTDPNNRTSASFAFFSEEPSTFTCQLDTEPVESCERDPVDPENDTKGTKTYTGLAESTHTFTVTATDAAGNGAMLGFNWTIDVTAPTLSITAGPLDPTRSNTASFKFASSEASSFTCQLDAAAPGTPGPCDPDPDDPGNPANGAKTYIGLGEGSYTFTVTAADRAGSVASTTFSWLIDVTAPTLTISTPLDADSFVIGQVVAAAYSCSDSLSGLETCVGPVPSGSNIDTASLGVKTFTVRATDRAGNAASQTVNYSVVPPLPPDLLETAVGNPPSAAQPGSSFVATDTVLNQGGTDAAPSITRYYLSLDQARDGSDILLVGSRAIPTLTPGASSLGSVTLTTPASIPLRKYYLLACADDTALVTESNESNNCRASAGVVQVTRPDLVETALSNPPASAAPGTSFKLVDTIQNQGLVDSGTSKTRYYLSTDGQRGSGDTLLSGSRSVPGLEAGLSFDGASLTVTIPSSTPLGSYYLLACADDTALVIETDESNNCLASSTLVRVTWPELVETEISNPPTAASPGSSFKVTDTVQNQGLVDSGPSTTRYYLSVDPQKSSGDKLLTGSRSVPGLAAGSSYSGASLTLQIPSTMPLATYYLLACADDARRVIETDEGNNCRASATHVQVTRPDLVQTAVSNPPATASSGSNFRVTDTVLNQALVAASASTTRYYLSANQQKGSGDTLLSGSRSVPALSAGASFSGSSLTVTIPSSTPLGTYYLLACADDTTLVTESDEGNNCLASASQVSVTQ